MTTMAEFERALAAHLPGDLRARVRPLAELLAEVSDGGVPEEQIQRRLAGQPGLGPVVRALANKEIKVNGSSVLIATMAAVPAPGPRPAPAQDNRVAILVNNGSAEDLTAFNVQQNEYTTLTITLSGTRVDPAAPPVIVRCPVLGPPPEPLGFYDRAEALDRLAARLKPRQGAWLAGQAGAGLTTLLEKAANLRPARGFARRDGVAFLDGWLEPRDADDLAQSLYNRFFMRDDGSTVRLHPQARRAALGQLKALFVLDRPRVEREQLIALARDLGRAGSVLIAGESAGPPWLEQLEVAALPGEDARRLFAEAARLGGDPASLALADRLCAALDCLPLAMLVVARLVHAGRAPDLTALADEAEAQRRGRPEALMRAAALALKALDEAEAAALRAIVGGLPAGGTLDVVATICEAAQDEVAAALFNLARLGLVVQSGDHYSVATASLRAALGRLVPHEAERKRAVPTLAAMAAARFGDGAWLEREWVNLLQAARTALAGGQSQEAATLLRAIQPHVTAKGLWQSWGGVAAMAGRAARQSGDRALEAWALHEQGTRAGMAGDLDRAAESLGRAYELRVALGDEVGAALTRHNMAYFGLLLPPEPGEPEPAEAPLSPGPALGPAWLAALGLALVALVGVGVALVARPWAQAPPSIRIETPEPGRRFRPGETIVLRATAADSQERVLPAEALAWAVTLRSPSGDRELPLATAGGAPSVTLPAEVDLATAAGGYLEITVAAADGQGRRGQASARLDAVTAPLTLDSSPPGLALAIAGEHVTTPYTAALWAGLSLEVSAPTTIAHEGRRISFEGWSDGVEAPRRPLRTGDEAQTLIAAYGARIVSCQQPELAALEDAGQTAIALSLDKPAAEPVVVDYRVEALEAAPGGDFRLEPGALTFAPGQTSQLVTVDLVDDAVDEPAERLRLQLAPREGAIPGGEGHCELTIADDDGPPAVALGAGAYVVRESAGSLAVEVRLDNLSAFTTTVRLQARAGTAQPGEDFALPVATLAFAPGEQRAAARVVIVDDSRFEEAEGLELVVEPLEHLAQGEPSRAAITIEDDDARPALSLASAGPVGEGAGVARLTITSSQPLPEPLTLGLEAGAGSAIAGEDFTLPAAISMPAGSRAATVEVPIVQDDLYEADQGDERVELRLLPAAGVDLAVASAALEIVDDEARPVVSFSQARVACDEPSATGRGRAGVAQVAPTGCDGVVGLVSNVRAARPLSVTLNLLGGSAQPGADFVMEPVVTFAPGARTAALSWRVSADRLYERPESASFELAPGGPALVGDIVTTTVLIRSRDPMPALTLVYPDEVAESAGEVVVRAVLARESGVEVSLVLETVDRRGAQDGTPRATPGVDYQPASEALTIAAGATEVSLRVRIVPDQIAEGLEIILIQARDVREAVPPEPAIVSVGIRDEPPRLGFAPIEYPVSEGSASQAAADARQAQIQPGAVVNLEVVLLQASAQAVSVEYTTVDGAAVAGQDFVAASGTLSIPAGETRARIDVLVLRDGLFEGGAPEAFQVVLANPSGTILGEATATVLIQDADPQPTVTFLKDVYTLSEGTNTPQSLTLEVVLSGPAAAAVSVDLALGGSAELDQDYRLSTTRVTFAPGATRTSITLTTVPDDIDEANETATIAVADPALAGAIARCDVQILDDDTQID